MSDNRTSAEKERQRLELEAERAREQEELRASTEGKQRSVTLDRELKFRLSQIVEEEKRAHARADQKWQEAKATISKERLAAERKAMGIPNTEKRDEALTQARTLADRRRSEANLMHNRELLAAAEIRQKHEHETKQQFEHLKKEAATDTEHRKQLAEKHQMEKEQTAARIYNAEKSEEEGDVTS